MKNITHVKKTGARGFVALITVLILSSVMLVSVVSLAQYGMTTRFALLDLENKTKSESLANACVAVTRIAVVNDSSYVVSIEKSVAVGSDVCKIESIAKDTPSSGTSRIKVSATIPSNGATTNYQFDVNTTTGAITRFVELPN